MHISHIVFYGTLMSKGKTKIHENIRTGLVYQGHCTFAGSLYNLGRYPGLKKRERVIKGELYEILDCDLIRLLDEYEAHDNEDPTLPGFARKAIDIIEPRIKAWVYYYEGDVSEKILLRSNRWHKPV